MKKFLKIFVISIFFQVITLNVFAGSDGTLEINHQDIVNTRILTIASEKVPQKVHTKQEDKDDHGGDTTTAALTAFRDRVKRSLRVVVNVAPDIRGRAIAANQAAAAAGSALGAPLGGLLSDGSGVMGVSISTEIRFCRMAITCFEYNMIFLFNY